MGSGALADVGKEEAVGVAALLEHHDEVGVAGAGAAAALDELTRVVRQIEAQHQAARRQIQPLFRYGRRHQRVDLPLPDLPQRLLLLLNQKKAKHIT